MVYYGVKGIKTYVSFSDVGMPVFSCTAGVFAVVNMEHRNLLQTDEAVKMI